MRQAGIRRSSVIAVEALKQARLASKLRQVDSLGMSLEDGFGPNMVSCAGLVPVMRLVVAGMVADADCMMIWSQRPTVPRCARTSTNGWRRWTVLLGSCSCRRPLRGISGGAVHAPGRRSVIKPG